MNAKLARVIPHEWHIFKVLIPLGTENHYAMTYTCDEGQSFP